MKEFAIVPLIASLTRPLLLTTRERLGRLCSTFRPLKDPISMLSQMFYRHGHMCATHPWEVILAFLTVTICLLSVGMTAPMCGLTGECKGSEDSTKGIEAVVLTTARCMAVLYVYHQFRRLYRLGSKYLVGIAGLLTVFSSFVFSSTFVNLLDKKLSELNVALPFFLLLMDFSKAGLLAQFALSASSKEEVRLNIAEGMAILGPAITLDTLVETLVIGVGMLSDVRRLEHMCCYACMSAVVNYIVFMTFFPACLSLIIELSRERKAAGDVWRLARVLQQPKEEDQMPNPVLQRVKVIMSAGLVLVHARSRWSPSPQALTLVPGTEPPVPPSLDSWLLPFSVEQMVILVLASALAIKYIWFETREDIPTPCRASLPELHRPTPIRKVSWPLVNADLGGYPPSLTCSESGGSKTETPSQSEQSTQTGEEEPGTPTASPAAPVEGAKNGYGQMSDQEILQLVEKRIIAPYKLESVLGDAQRGIAIRRLLISKSANSSLMGLPFQNYDYAKVTGTCCENVIGYVPIPVGIAGPLILDGCQYYVPMATTEGCLVASTNRGCRALALSGGVVSSINGDGMTRGPVVKLPTARQASEIYQWLLKKENFDLIKLTFDSSSRFARLQKIHAEIAGCHLYIRFVAFTGDAMGMNMLSKGTELALATLQEHFPEMQVLSLSGNYCTDKKPAAINWIMGRGKHVVCEAEVPAKVVRDVLKTSPEVLVELNISKNLVGSAMAGSIGGFNAQAANIVTAVFIATGQDPAQNVGSSNCLTQMELRGGGSALHVSVTMPSVEVGTVGGGTGLGPQAALLDLLGVRGSSPDVPGQNAALLARIMCATVLAGELSLMSALAAGHLVRAHMKHNRFSKKTASSSNRTIEPSEDTTTPQSTA